MTARSLADFNAMDRASAMARARQWCGSTRWSGDMADARPFEDLNALCLAARRCWQAAADEDRLEAFAAHPMIGDVAVLRARFAARAHAEQGQVLTAPDSVLERLAALNADYRRRHGFIFIVCATGRGAADLLALLEARIGRPTAEELITAAGEQTRITELRIRRDLGEAEP